MNGVRTELELGSVNLGIKKALIKNILHAHLFHVLQ
jgi:hypothetical protein